MGANITNISTTSMHDTLSIGWGLNESKTPTPTVPSAKFKSLIAKTLAPETIVKDKSHNPYYCTFHTPIMSRGLFSRNYNANNEECTDSEDDCVQGTISTSNNEESNPTTQHKCVTDNGERVPSSSASKKGSPIEVGSYIIDGDGYIGQIQILTPKLVRIFFGAEWPDTADTDYHPKFALARIRVVHIDSLPCDATPMGINKYNCELFDRKAEENRKRHAKVSRLVM